MFAMWTPVMLIGALRDVAACNWTENDSTDSNAEVITGSVIGGIVMIAIVVLVAVLITLLCYKMKGRKWDIRYLFQFRVTEDVVMSNSEVVIYNRQRSPNNQYQSHQTPADASGVENTCSAAERSCAVSYADPVDTLINLPHSYDSCVDNGLYAGPKYEEPRSFDARPTYSTGYSTVFQMAGTYVPTLEERSVIIEGGYEVQNSMKMKHQYSKLSFFKESKVYWAPASTASGLYAQFSAKRYREITRQQLRLLEQIGSGCSANICKGLWVCENESMFVAVKTLKENASENDQIKFLQEAATMGQFWHPNVIALHGVITVGELCHIVLEYAPNGDLLKYLKNIRITNKVIDNPMELQKQFLEIASEVANGMMYLARKKFVHRDLAARNILLDSHMKCKIADFGLTRHLTENVYYASCGGQIPIKWTAPEALFYQRYSSASDVWSFGMVVYEMWALGLPPFRNMSMDEIIKIHNTRRGYCLPPPPGTPRLIYKLMVHCWHPEPKERATFRNLYQSLCQPEDYLLSWSEDDIPDLARQLGADHTHSQNLHSDLQTRYIAA